MSALDGVVVAFDDARGDGWIEARGERYYFHCVSIVDGSRTIAVGAPVTARRVAGHLGRDEATDVAPRGLDGEV